MKYFTGGPKPAQRRQPHPQFRCGSRHTDIWPARKTPNPPTHHPPKTHKSRYNKEIKQGQGPNSKPNRTPEQKKPNRQTPAGPTNSQSTRPPPSHQQISLQVGTTTEPEARPTGVQLKRKAKLPTVIGLTTKHAVCCNTLML